MKPAAAIAATTAAAFDHGRPLIHYAGVALCDVRADFPSTQIGRTMAPREGAQYRDGIAARHDPRQCIAEAGRTRCVRSVIRRACT